MKKEKFTLIGGTRTDKKIFVEFSTLGSMIDYLKTLYLKETGQKYTKIDLVAKVTNTYKNFDIGNYIIVNDDEVILVKINEKIPEDFINRSLYHMTQLFNPTLNYTLIADFAYIYDVENVYAKKIDCSKIDKNDITIDLDSEVELYGVKDMGIFKKFPNVSKVSLDLDPRIILSVHSLPKSIIELDLGDSYDYPIGGILHEGLEILHVGKKYSYDISSTDLPKSIKRVYVNNNIIIVDSSITYFVKKN